MIELIHFESFVFMNIKIGYSYLDNESLSKLVLFKMLLSGRLSRKSTLDPIVIKLDIFWLMVMLLFCHNQGPTMKSKVIIWCNFTHYKYIVWNIDLKIILYPFKPNSYPFSLNLKSDSFKFVLVSNMKILCKDLCEPTFLQVCIQENNEALFLEPCF